MAEQEAIHPSDERLLKYLNIDLPFDEMVFVERHIEGCRQCKGKVKELREKSDKVVIDDEFESINSMLTANEEQDPQSRSKTKLFTSIIIIVAIIVMAGYYFDWKVPQYDRQDAQLPVTSDRDMQESDLPDPEDITMDDELPGGEEEQEPIEMETEETQDGNDVPTSVADTRSQTVSDPIVSTNPTTTQPANNNQPPATEETQDLQPTENEVIAEPVVQEPVIVTMNAEPQPGADVVPAAGWDQYNTYLKNNFSPDESLADSDMLFLLEVDSLGNPVTVQLTQGSASDKSTEIGGLLNAGPRWEFVQPDSLITSRQVRILIQFRKQ